MTDENRIPSDEEFLRMKKAWGEAETVQYTIRASEKHKDTGQIIIDSVNASFSFIPGTMYRRPSYCGEEIDGIIIGAYCDEVLVFLKGLEEEAKRFVPLVDLLDMLWFEPKDERADDLLNQAINQYLKEKGQ